MRVSSILPSPRSWRRKAHAAATALSVAATVALAPVQAQAQSVIRDTEIEGILRSWSDPVFTAMGLPPDDVTMLLIDDPSLNAFATVNQTMGLNTGIILEADSPNELLGVIAHEGGHFRNRHVLRNGAREAGMQPMIV